jgi:hypothetical protein
MDNHKNNSHDDRKKTVLAKNGQSWIGAEKGKERGERIV